jgi:hypothetical protein
MTEEFLLGSINALIETQKMFESLMTYITNEIERKKQKLKELKEKKLEERSSCYDHFSKDFP